MKYSTSVLVTFILISFCITLSADTKLAFFETKIRPVLVEHCYKCHSIKSGKDKGGLLVDSRSALLKGGDSGPSIVPGNPEESLLISAISYKDLDLQMPEKKQLPKHIVDNFVKWVKDGAADPRKTAGTVEKRTKMSDGRRDHWSFQPIKKSNFSQTSIDAFIDHAIESKGINKTVAAKPEELLRRVYIDLIGLPPSPEEIAEFTENPSRQNYEKTVDRLIKSEQFGVKWGRFWLDLARYAETAGGGRSYPVPITWRYRSYVIDTFNNDTPYNHFLKEQVAGDLLESKNDKEKARNLVATGFMAIGAKPLDLQNKEQLTLDHVDEQLDTLGKVTMGMTIGCARCHDHEFDPITTRDYYRMSAIFQNTNAMTKANISNFSVFALPGGTEKDVKEAVKNIETYRSLGTSISSLERKLQSGDSKIQKQMAEKVSKLAQLIKEDSVMQVTIGMNDKKTLKHGHIRIRGVADNKGPKVKRGGPKEFLKDLQPEEIPENSSGRLQLVNWITHEDNPLTSRVYVNRVWAQLFGKGIVSSLDNFGTTGTLPTHPELLDFLATKFMKNNWSTKNLIRSIVLSSTYKMSSKPLPESLEKDADNDLLSYYPRRRLQAEAIRDSILQISGELDTSPVHGVLPYKELQTSSKRSIFLPTLREEGRNFLLDAFDFPDTSASMGERNSTNLPSQALFLMNSPFIIDQSKISAKKLLSEGVELTVDEKLDRASLAIYGRKLKSNEKKIFQTLLDDSGSKEETWQTIIHAMFCSVDFRFLN